MILERAGELEDASEVGKQAEGSCLLEQQSQGNDQTKERAAGGESEEEIEVRFEL